MAGCVQTMPDLGSPLQPKKVLRIGLDTLSHRYTHVANLSGLTHSSITISDHDGHSINTNDVWLHGPQFDDSLSSSVLKVFGYGNSQIPLHREL
jgi:hypothetical protein